MTVRVVDPEIDPDVAVMDVVPAAAIPFANPALLIVALPTEEELQVTLLVDSVYYHLNNSRSLKIVAWRPRLSKN